MEWRSLSILIALIVALVASSCSKSGDPGRAISVEPPPVRTQKSDHVERARDLDPKHLIPADLLATAVGYYDLHQASFTNQNVLSVVDLRPRSDRLRFFVINLRDGSVKSYHTSHGNGSVEDDPAVAVKFGNVPESNRSSLGFIRTGSVYVGSLKRSLRLQGLSETNSNLLTRAIVIHGDDDMHEADVVQGLSAGCFMFDWKVRDEVINALRDGSLIYVGLSAVPAVRALDGAGDLAPEAGAGAELALTSTAESGSIDSAVTENASNTGARTSN